MIVCSTFLIVTAGCEIPRTHADSHGAGHTRPVNSGKLFVAWSSSTARAVCPRHIASLNSGMVFPSGHPWWQKGTPQSMQRPACRTNADWS